MVQLHVLEEVQEVDALCKMSLWKNRIAPLCWDKSVISPGKNNQSGNIKQQAEEHSIPGTIWHTLVFKNEEDHYELFCDMVDKGLGETSAYPGRTCNCKFIRDAAGGTVLHIALLVKKYKFANYLLDKYGPANELIDLVRKPNLPMFVRIDAEPFGN